MKIPDFKIADTRYSDVNKSRNVLLLSMSTLPPSTDPNYYFFAENAEYSIKYQVFSGVSQLEPGTKLVISELAAQGVKLDRIIVLTTPETVIENEKHGGKTAVEVYSGNIDSFIKNGEVGTISPYQDAVEERLKQLMPGVAPKLYTGRERIAELYTAADNDLIKTVPMDERSLLSIIQLLKELSSKNHVNLFIDLQGGSRSFMFTLFAATTLLRDKNVTIKDMFAIKYDRTYSIHPLEIVTQEYAIIDLVSGIRAFSQYGKVDELQQFLNSRELKSGTEKDLLDIMERIDGHMQINNPEGFSNELQKLAEDNAEILNQDSFDDIQFKLIADDLQDAYAPLIVSSHTVLDQIVWFAQRSFLSSALTFIEDKIPGYMLSINSTDKSIINVSYNDQVISEEEIVKCYSGQKYYKLEHNIFNACFKKITNDIRDKCYRKICLYWAERLMNACSGEYTVKLGYLIEKDKISTDLLNDNSSLKTSFLNLERYLGDTTWESVKLKKIFAFIEGKDGNWGKFKIDNNIKGNKDKTTVADEGMNRGQVLNMIPDKNRRDIFRIETVFSYLQSAPVSLDVSDVDHKNIFKEALRWALYCIFFANDEKHFGSIINNMIKPVFGDKTDVFMNVSVKNDQVEYLNGYNRYSFLFRLWKELMIIAGYTYEKIDETLSSYAASTEMIASIEVQLKDLENRIADEKTAETALLVEFADLYIKCRERKTSIKNLKENSVYDPECSYRNSEIISRFVEDPSCIFEYLIIDDNGIPMETIAGVPDGQIDNNISMSIGDISVQKRSILNKCILFYQAFKEERNATNHAEESDSAHMDYRFIKKAILVFAELCNRIVEMD